VHKVCIVFCVELAISTSTMKKELKEWKEVERKRKD
jgi:hypothetical protein